MRGNHLDQPERPARRNSAASPSGPPSLLATTARPAASGTSTLVTVRSNASDVCSGTPCPPPTPYAATAQVT